MSQTVFDKINKINENFYSQEFFGEEFSRTRNYYWQGWQELYTKFNLINLLGKNILDVGCGNGRFASFLEEILSKEFYNKTLLNYLGIDFSNSLLKEAILKNKQNKYIVSEYKNGDLLNFDIWKKEKIGKKFDLITVFGVMHHLIGKKNRLQFLINCCDNLKKNGYLIITFWDFYNRKIEIDKQGLDIFRKNFFKKMEILPNQLEKNDYLLGWKNNVNQFRYCHYYTKKEIHNLFVNSQLILKSSFESDFDKKGDKNYYCILQKKI